MKSKRKLIIHPEVYSEFAKGGIWYEAESQGLGEEFVDEVESAFSKIINSPETWLNYGKGTKRLIVRRFPYSIIYYYNTESVFILAVAHQKRKPFYWKARKF